MTLSVDVTARRGTFAVRASFDAGRGSTTALLGPNGSGKSTLVASMAGLVPPEEGSVVLDRVVLDEPAADVFVPPERRGRETRLSEPMRRLAHDDRVGRRQHLEAGGDIDAIPKDIVAIN